MAETAARAEAGSGGLFLLLAFADLRRCRLLRANTPAEVITNTTEFMTAVVVMFALSIPVAFVTQWASLCWLLLPVLRHAVRLVRRRTLAAA